MKSYIKSAFFALAAPMLFTACSSDSNNEPAPVSEEFEGIELAIPSNMLQTRAVDDPISPSDNEATISTLTIVAYNQAATNTAKIIRKTGSELVSNAHPIHNTYSKVNVPLAKGVYHIYVFANLTDNALTTPSGVALSESMSETDFKTLRITGAALIQNDKVNGTSRDTYLPMSCYYTDVKADADGADFTDASGNNTPGVVTISTGKSTAVYANLTFAVAKVKLSLTNNTSKGVTIADGPKFSKLATSLAAFGEEAKKLTGASEATLDGKYFALGTAFNNNATPDWKNESLANLRGAELSNDGEKTNLWTWFGEGFICERLYEDTTEDANKVNLYIEHSSGDKSTTALKGSLDGNKALGFKRSYCYEIVGKIDAKAVTLEVRVKPWVYNKEVYDLEENGSVTPAE